MDFKWDMTKQMLGAIIRYALAIVAGWLVAHEIVPAGLADAWLNEIVAIVTGLVVFGAIFIWRLILARTKILELIKAVQVDPPADTPKEVNQAVADVKAEVAAAPETTVSF